MIIFYDHWRSGRYYAFINRVKRESRLNVYTRWARWRMREWHMASKLYH
jgi:hypothetical protein